MVDLFAMVDLSIIPEELFTLIENIQQNFIFYTPFYRIFSIVNNAGILSKKNFVLLWIDLHHYSLDDKSRLVGLIWHNSFLFQCNKEVGGGARARRRANRRGQYGGSNILWSEGATWPAVRLYTPGQLWTHPHLQWRTVWISIICVCL